jgi:hypothetical protein
MALSSPPPAGSAALSSARDSWDIGKLALDTSPCVVYARMLLCRRC